jgi:polysaccharide export outer membrane protein
VARGALLMGAVLVLTGCALPRGAALQSEVIRAADSRTEAPFEVVAVSRDSLPRLAIWPDAAEPPTRWPSQVGNGGAHVIRTGDLLDVTVWDSQENSLLTAPGARFTQIEAVEVDARGAIFLPYVEMVEVAGLSPTEARSRIQARLEAIVPSAQVQLAQTQGRDTAIDVLGAVGTPGAYPLGTRNYRVLSLLADAGGIPTGLRNPQIRLLRGEETFSISAERLFESAAFNISLRPRDSLIVEEDNRSFVALGASGTEDLIYFPKNRVSALEAVSLMGGLADSRADPGGVLILRDFPTAAVRGDGSGPAHPQVVFTLDLTSADGLFAARRFPIHPGDALLATESPINNARTILGLIGSAIGLTNQATNLSN